MTVRDLIEGSLRLLGAISTGQNASAAEAADGLSSLNQMISSWSTNGLTVFKQTREEFDLVPSQSVYTIGAGGNFNTSRPVDLNRAAIQINGSEIPIDILQNQEQWADIISKSVTSSFPCAVYLDGSYPLNNLNVWPVPSVSTKLVLYSKKAITNFVSVNDVISMPEGYERALRFNLAVEMAPEFNKEPSATTFAIAQESLGNIKRMNLKPVIVECDSALIGDGVFDIYSGGQ